MTNIKPSESDKLITAKDIENLAKVHDQHCISIYIPISKAGEDVDQRKNQLKLKNSIKKVKNTLKNYYLNENETDDLLQPLNDLLEDNQFWRYLSDCLVVFLNEQEFRVYTVPIQQEEFVYVADHFYLLPLLPVLNQKKNFYILSLSLKDVKLFTCTPNSIAELDISNQVPQQLEDAVGYDYKEKSLQFRTGQGGDAGAMFHGQGSAKDNKNTEIEKYFRAVDSGLMKLISDKETPLILACVDHYYPIYSKITNYPALYKEHISGNHEETNPNIMHQMAGVLIDKVLGDKKDDLGKIMQDQTPVRKTSFDLNDIVPAAVDGRIEVLFIQKSTDRYGLYDKLNRSLIVDEQSKINQASLFNLAAIHTWLRGGRVYMAEKNNMPFKGTSINALFRY